MGTLIVASLATCLFLITRHTRLVITAVTTDDRNPLTNTDTTTVHEDKTDEFLFYKIAYSGTCN